MLHFALVRLHQSSVFSLRTLAPNPLVTTFLAQIVTIEVFTGRAVGMVLAWGFECYGADLCHTIVTTAQLAAQRVQFPIPCFNVGGAVRFASAPITVSIFARVIYSVLQLCIFLSQRLNLTL